MKVNSKIPRLIQHEEKKTIGVIWLKNADNLVEVAESGKAHIR